MTFSYLCLQVSYSLVRVWAWGQFEMVLGENIDKLQKYKEHSNSIFSNVPSGLKFLAANDLKQWHNGASVC